MNNQTRRELLNRHRQSGFPGSIMDVFSAYDAGRDIISEFVQEQQGQQQLQQMQQMQQQQQQPQPIVANTPEQQEQGLRPFHERGQVDQSMVFPNVPANTPFNTVGMKAPINIDKYDNNGHLIESFKSVPPGIQNLPTGPQEGTVVETPANMQTGGVRRYQTAGPRRNPNAEITTLQPMDVRPDPLVRDRPAQRVIDPRAQRQAEEQAFQTLMFNKTNEWRDPNKRAAMTSGRAESVSPATYVTPAGDLQGIIESGTQIAEGNYLEGGLGAGLAAASVLLPGTIRVPGKDLISKAAEYATTKTPLRNAYKLNPKALTLDDIEILQRWQADELPVGVPQGIPDKYTGRWYGSNYDMQSKTTHNTVPGVQGYMGIRPGPGEIRTAVVPKGSANLPEEFITGMLSGKTIFPEKERMLPEGFGYNVTRVNNNPVDYMDLESMARTASLGKKLADKAIPKPHWLRGYKLTNTPNTNNNGSSLKYGGVRKYQQGGGKNIDPFSAFEVAKHMARIHGGTPQQYLALSDTSGYHESGHTMDPKMVQRGSGIAKGAFQIEASTVPRLQQRVRQYAEQTGNKVPSWINIPNNDARNLSLDRQRALFLLDMNYSEGTNMRAYAQGKTTSAEQWLRGWKRKEAVDGKDIERFETSANKARQMGIPNSALTEFNRMVQGKKPIPPSGSYQDLIRQLNPLNQYK